MSAGPATNVTGINSQRNRLGRCPSLAARGGWQIHIVDLKEGKKLDVSLPDVSFRKADLTNYAEFDAAFKQPSFYEDTGKTLDPPPEIDSASIEFWKTDRVRVNSLCSEAIKTPIIPMETRDNFPERSFTPPDQISKGVVMLADGEELVDLKSVGIHKEEATGQTVVVNGKNFYVIRAPEYCDESTEAVTEGTRVEKQAGLIYKKV
ncbi:hypothetical protein DL764_003202 [Monosporascus ibericus]|uniref:Uncharacterized protein n=1 Tax=Monosporascus ibericus TaxID=155417 RepID=A0A4Q4TKR4_9PEZI|nr:hypothetical protein DL764_003202 [Monosporascus ibericus]